MTYSTPKIRSRTDSLKKDNWSVSKDGEGKTSDTSKKEKQDEGERHLKKVYNSKLPTITVEVKRKGSLGKEFSRPPVLFTQNNTTKRTHSTICSLQGFVLSQKGCLLKRCIL